MASVDDSNLECQHDELLALSSIYDERIFTRSETEMEGVANVYLDLPNPFEVKVERRPNEKYTLNSSQLNMEVFQVKYLPPLVLNFNLPPGYPSSEPPSFTLTCKWLTSIQLSKLCNLMDSLWKENEFNEVLYPWIQFLQEETILELNISSPLVLSSKMFSRQGTSRKSVSSNVDPRAVQDISSCSVLLDTILNFDQEERDRVFKTNRYSCGVCFSEKLGSACISFPKCDHVFCCECVAEYFKLQIEDGSVKALTCPETKCESQALPSQVKNLVSADLFAKYDKFLLQSSLDEMTDIVYCPRPACQSPVILEKDTTMGVCLVCRFAFCSLCKLTYHGVSPCVFRPEEVQKLKMQYENANPSEKLFLERRYGKNRIRQLIDNLVSEEWMKDNSKACPRCGARIQKSEGCNKMTCTKCRTHFCWLCGKILRHENPYIHFNLTNSSCFNRLFEGVQVDNEYDDYDDDEL